MLTGLDLIMSVPVINSYREETKMYITMGYRCNNSSHSLSIQMRRKSQWKNDIIYKHDIIFQDVLGERVNIVSIGKEKAYISVIFVNLKEKFPV